MTIKFNNKNTLVYKGKVRYFFNTSNSRHNKIQKKDKKVLF